MNTSGDDDFDALTGRLTRRREHLLSEMSATLKPGWHWRLSRRAAALVIAVGTATALGGGVVAAQSDRSEPNVINFDRQDLTCDADWSCLSAAANALGTSVIGPRSGTQIGTLAAISSQHTTSVMLGYRFKPVGSSITVEGYARRGHDSAMTNQKPRSQEKAHAHRIRVADQDAYLLPNRLYVHYDGLYYLFTTSSNDDPKIMERVAKDLQLVPLPQ
jgi:hypothetical protein